MTVYLERGLNWAGYVPLVGEFSGPIRQIYGVTQLVAAAAIAAFYFIQDRPIPMESIQHYSVQGIGSLARGQVEATPFCNLLCLVYDSLQGTTIDKALSSVERKLNKIGYIPVISVLSGMQRQMLGVVEAIGAVTYICFNILNSLTADRAKRLQLAQENAHVAKYVLHGSMNVVRGQIETVSTVIVANWPCFIYDSFGYRWRYEGE